MASSKKYARINPILHMQDSHVLSDGKTVLTRKPTELTAAQLKEVLEFMVNGQPVAVETEAPTEAEAETATADNAEG